MRKRYLILAFAVAAVAVMAGWLAPSQSPIERLFGGAENVSIVARPERVEAYRLGPLPDAINPQNAKLSDYPTIAGPVVLPEEVAAEVTRALVSPGAYVWDMASACEPVYGVKLSFIRGSERVDVLVCFECLILRAGRDGKAFDLADFDPGAAALIKAAKVAFPGDAEIQGL